MRRELAEMKVRNGQNEELLRVKMREHKASAAAAERYCAERDGFYEELEEVRMALEKASDHKAQLQKEVRNTRAELQRLKEQSAKDEVSARQAAREAARDASESAAALRAEEQKHAEAQRKVAELVAKAGESRAAANAKIEEACAKATSASGRAHEADAARATLHSTLQAADAEFAEKEQRQEAARRAAEAIRKLQGGADALTMSELRAEVSRLHAILASRPQQESREVQTDEDDTAGRLRAAAEVARQLEEVTSLRAKERERAAEGKKELEQQLSTSQARAVQADKVAAEGEATITSLRWKLNELAAQEADGQRSLQSLQAELECERHEACEHLASVRAEMEARYTRDLGRSSKELVRWRDEATQLEAKLTPLQGEVGQARATLERALAEALSEDLAIIAGHNRTTTPTKEHAATAIRAAALFNEPSLLGGLQRLLQLYKRATESLAAATGEVREMETLLADTCDAKAKAETSLQTTVAELERAIAQISADAQRERSTIVQAALQSINRLHAYVVTTLGELHGAAAARWTEEAESWRHHRTRWGLPLGGERSLKLPPSRSEVLLTRSDNTVSAGSLARPSVPDSTAGNDRPSGGRLPHAGPVGAVNTSAPRHAPSRIPSSRSMDTIRRPCKHPGFSSLTQSESSSISSQLASGSSNGVSDGTPTLSPVGIAEASEAATVVESCEMPVVGIHSATVVERGTDVTAQHATADVSIADTAGTLSKSRRLVPPQCKQLAVDGSATAPARRSSHEVAKERRAEDHAGVRRTTSVPKQRHGRSEAPPVPPPSPGRTTIIAPFLSQSASPSLRLVTAPWTPPRMGIPTQQRKGANSKSPDVSPTVTSLPLLRRGYSEAL